MRHFAIEEETVISLIMYLETKPYKEVQPVIDTLKSLTMITINPPEEDNGKVTPIKKA